MYDLIIFLTLLTLGYVFGRIAEKRHFKSIIKREEQLRDILTFSERLPAPGFSSARSELVSGNVVISIDYFKRIAAGLRSLIGGRVTAYETLIERARREAILRMKEDARRMGASQIINVKLETASITKGSKDQTGCVEVYAYGTALIQAP
ncbi:YbjQ family protein [Parendozoicomonas sp. Alg238-R29]|uniref:YbjQ family protein n=1 Tax=Parendozoicomonas sp. Alg238-R29 TaxID=2993446 RepID=UPI00248E391B|nr:YbjQ family protein [Parendozoicomonas sp. Alg238-R29]